MPQIPPNITNAAVTLIRVFLQTKDLAGWFPLQTIQKGVPFLRNTSFSCLPSRRRTFESNPSLRVAFESAASVGRDPFWVGLFEGNYSCLVALKQIHLDNHRQFAGVRIPEENTRSNKLKSMSCKSQATVVDEGLDPWSSKEQGRHPRRRDSCQHQCPTVPEVLMEVSSSQQRQKNTN